LLRYWRGELRPNSGDWRLNRGGEVVEEIKEKEGSRLV
jgi:hypothetical protein